MSAARSSGEAGDRLDVVPHPQQRNLGEQLEGDLAAAGVVEGQPVDAVGL
jgi:hypothetical protein